MSGGSFNYLCPAALLPLARSAGVLRLLPSPALLRPLLFDRLHLGVAGLTRQATMGEGAMRETWYHRLLILGSGDIVLAPRKRDWGPLLRRGWVVEWKPRPGTHPNEARGLLPPLRVTALGLRALASAVDMYGLPEPYGPVVGRASSADTGEKGDACN